MSIAKEIGSYFYISLEDTCNSVIEKKFEPFGDALYLSTCRSAIDMALKAFDVKNKVALLPGFTCHAVVEPFLKNSYCVIPYAIKENFEIDQEDLLKKVADFNPSVILIHDYFGFDSNRKVRESGILEKFRELGIVILNDQTQSMFSSYGRLAGDYFFGSIRKWIGIPDGAYLSGLRESVCCEPDTELEKAKLKAMVYKYNYLFKGIGTKDEVLHNYKKAEAILDSRDKPYAISDMSKSLINCYDLESVKRCRQENGRILLASIAEKVQFACPFLSINANEVPFYIPILVKENRSKFQRYLAQNKVFATVIWSCPEGFEDRIDAETRNIYSQILCIPCDQRYTKEDMQYIGKLISRFNCNA